MAKKPPIGVTIPEGHLWCFKCEVALPEEKFYFSKAHGRRISPCSTCKNSRGQSLRSGYAERGRCGCGNPTTEGKRSCEGCIGRSNLRNKQNRKTDRGPMLAAGKRAYDRLKSQVFKAYGGKCACCSSRHALSVDHVNGDGAAHRKVVGKSIYGWLKKNGFPKEGFQLLCLSCNRDKGTGVSCSHAELPPERLELIRFCNEVEFDPEAVKTYLLGGK